MDKSKELIEFVKKLGRVCVAYSGGVDSDVVLNASVKALGKENVMAVTANGIMLSKKDLEDAKELANSSGAELKIIDIDAFSVNEFRFNDKKRCYYCKKNILENIFSEAERLGYKNVLDGKNADDIKSYRPGGEAAKELGVISPLYETGFTKQDVRDTAKAMGLKSWDKISNSCLATRFPYNTELTAEDIKKVEQAEELFAKANILPARVRLHGDIARIEVSKSKFDDVINSDILENMKKIGFRYVTLDIEGYRSGSMD